MQPDSEVLLVLLAVRMFGPNAPAKHAVFTALKKFISKASELRLIEMKKIDVPFVNKKGNAGTKKEDGINLTDEGRRYLESHAGPGAQAAAIVASVAANAAAVAAQTRELQQELQADRVELRENLLASVKAKAKGADSSKEITALAKKLDDLAKQLGLLEAKVKPADGSDLVAQIDAAFANLEKNLELRLGMLAGTKPVPLSQPVLASTSSGKSLRSSLREAYETLCMFIEFDSGVVEIPRLYHEVRKAVPNLTVHAFHQELESLWLQKALELKVLNEVRSAKEQDKAIRRGDNLYYFVFWPNP